MIVDGSALLAVLNREPDADRFQGAILAASPCRMSVANMLEATIVVEGRGGAEAGHELTAFLEDEASRLVIEPRDPTPTIRTNLPCRSAGGGLFCLSFIL